MGLVGFQKRCHCAWKRNATSFSIYIVFVLYIMNCARDTVSEANINHKMKWRTSTISSNWWKLCELFDEIWTFLSNSLKWILITETSAFIPTTTTAAIITAAKTTTTAAIAKTTPIPTIPRNFPKECNKRTWKERKKNERHKKCELKMHHKFYLMLCAS